MNPPTTRHSARHPRPKAHRPFYAQRDQERLTARTKREAIVEILDPLGPDQPYPETVELCTYLPMTVNTRALTPLDNVLERLDEEYGDPWGETEPPQPTQAMRDAERVFLKHVAAQYTSFAHEITSCQLVDVIAWINQHPFPTSDGQKPNHCPQCGQDSKAPLFTGSDRRPRCAQCTLTLRYLGRLHWPYNPTHPPQDPTSDEPAAKSQPN